MKPNIFVDSDIILDLILARQPFVSEAKRLFVLVEAGKVKAHTTAVVFANIFYILRKQYSAESIKAILNNLRQLLSVIPINETCVDKALASPLADFEDALQFHSAYSSGLSSIITRNVKHYQNATIPAMTAGEFLAHFIVE
jgi:predicted nucleic acid-binding protein